MIDVDVRIKDSESQHAGECEQHAVIRNGRVIRVNLMWSHELERFTVTYQESFATGTARIPNPCAHAILQPSPNAQWAK